MDVSNMKGVPPSEQRVKILEDLIINRFGKATIKVNHTLREGSVVSCFKSGGEEYVIGSLIKIDGYGHALLNIRKCCGKKITNLDKEVLQKNNILNVLFLPGGTYTPDYNI